MRKSRKYDIVMAVSLAIWSGLVILTRVYLGAEFAADLFRWGSRMTWLGILGLIICVVVALWTKKRYRGGLLLEFVAAGFYVFFGLLIFGLASWLARAMLEALS